MTEPPLLNLKRAYYFVVLAEELHFGRAAARLFIAQPGLSQQIKVLEAELGVRLFERSVRDTHLTSAGEFFYREATRLLRETEEVLQRVRAQAEGRTSRLTVGLTRSTQFFEKKLVQEFRTLNPEIEVSTTAAWTALNIEMLRSHNADVAFVRPPVEPGEVEVLTLFSEEMVVALPAGHRLVDRASVVPADLVDEDILLSPRRDAPGHYDRIVTQVWGDGHPRVVLEEPDDDQRLSAVASGLGVTVLERQRAMSLRPEKVTIRRFADPVPTCYVGVAWRRGNHDPAVEAFIAVCRHRYLAA
jgi:DNA-binding transcriptional LysR family regulator